MSVEIDVSGTEEEAVERVAECAYGTFAPVLAKPYPAASWRGIGDVLRESVRAAVRPLVRALRAAEGREGMVRATLRHAEGAIEAFDAHEQKLKSELAAARAVIEAHDRKSLEAVRNPNVDLRSSFEALALVVRGNELGERALAVVLGAANGAR